jgi:hypothetical protein
MAFGWFDPKRLIGRRRLDRAGAEDQPAVIGGPLARRGCEIGFRERVREIGADRGALGDDRVAVLQRGNFAHRIDRAIVRPLHRRTEFDDLGPIGLPDLFQHPERDATSRHWMRIQDQFSGSKRRHSGQPFDPDFLTAPHQFGYGRTAPSIAALRGLSLRTARRSSYLAWPPRRFS